MFSPATNAVINTAALNQEPIKEALQEASQPDQPKTNVSVIQLRSVANGFGSRTESSQANVGMIGNVMRGQISNNARTRALRLALGDLVQADDKTFWGDVVIGEERGRSVGRDTFSAIRAGAPNADLAVALQIARAAAFVGVSKKKGDKKNQEAFDQRVASVLAACAKAAAGDELSEEELSLVNDPAQVICEEKTPQVMSVWDTLQIVRLVKSGESSLIQNKLLTELTPAQLWKEVEKIFTSSKPGLATACFGAMKADCPQASVYGGVSMNHAFTTSAAQVRQSMFANVSDNPSYVEHAGATHIGQKELSSGVFCEPYLVHIPTMRENLPYMSSPQLARAMSGVYEGMVVTTPNGGQRAHVTRAPAEFAVAVVTNLAPITYESAFLRPIQGGTDEGDMVTSARQLIDHIAGVHQYMGRSHFKVVVVAAPHVISELSNIPSDWIVTTNLADYSAQINALTGV